MNVYADFLKAMRAAIETVPRVLTAKNQVAERRAAFIIVKSEKDVNFNARMMERVEDVFDEIADVTEPCFDYSKIYAKISNDKLFAKAAKASVTQLWIERCARRAANALANKVR